ncbi:hypothetical protein [Priestia koreensis]|uniref:Uncharacterized protein n=1 Tax=Priestia koreensis TaxID=284581 RepID=A0A0M0L8X2_9BACI|nr:hypothetical protein [Priestia koreensis]KOO47469.1 hypothetical protein AMD01_05320 [Priestia koreensis]
MKQYCSVISICLMVAAFLISRLFLGEVSISPSIATLSPFMAFPILGLLFAYFGLNNKWRTFGLIGNSFIMLTEFIFPIVVQIYLSSAL